MQYNMHLLDILFHFRLDDNMVVKVSDFGLTRKVENLENNAPQKTMPIRWMSIEAIQCSHFTTKSDVVCMIKCNNAELFFVRTLFFKMYYHYSNQMIHVLVFLVVLWNLIMGNIFIW